MQQADIVDYRLLFTDRDIAAVRLSTARLRRSLRAQLLRLTAGGVEAYSVFVVYREGPMCFEASANLVVPEPPRSLGWLLRELIDDADFRAAVLEPLVREVDRHFGRRR